MRNTILLFFIVIFGISAAVSKQNKNIPLTKDYADAGILTIDSPSPDEYIDQKIYVTVMNYGTNTLKKVKIRWLYTDIYQGNVITPDDTTDDAKNNKLKKWIEKDFTFNPPIDSGKTKQVFISYFEGKLSDDILVVCTHKPNDLDDFAGNDTARIKYGDKILGKYSISSDTNYFAAFKSLKSAKDYLYDHGIYNNDDKDKKIWSMGGVEFFVRPGEYEGGLEFNGLIENQTVSNSITFKSYSDDSTKTIINAKDGGSYVLSFSNFRYFAFSGFHMKLPGSGHVIQFDGNVKDFVINKSILEGAATQSTSPDDALVYSVKQLDTCNISTCFLLNGSYGVYYAGSATSKNTVVGVSGCTFKNQANAAVSISHTQTPFINFNTIYNNRAEFVNCISPHGGDNRIIIDESKSTAAGQAYSAEPYSALTYLNCNDTLTCTGNNICVSNTDYYAVHIKGCTGTEGQPLVVNNCSLSSEKYALFIDGTEYLMINMTSLDLTSGNSHEKSALYVNASSSGVRLSRSCFNSSGGGYAVMTDNKNAFSFEIRNNYYTSAGDKVFARSTDHGDFSTVQSWHDYYGFATQNISTFLDPEFYSECDLTACNSAVQNGYGSCSSTSTPQHQSPQHNADNVDRNVNLQWSESNSDDNYWAQVSTSQSFAAAKTKNYLLTNEDLIFDVQNISAPYQFIGGLQPHTDYYWRVRVYSDVLRSDWSSPTKFKTGGVISVEETILDNGRFTVYPNPVYESCILEFETETELRSIEIIDLLGRVVVSKSFANTQAQKLFNISALTAAVEPGFYIIRLRTQYGIMSGKIIIN